MVRDKACRAPEAKNAAVALTKSQRRGLSEAASKTMGALLGDGREGLGGTEGAGGGRAEADEELAGTEGGLSVAAWGSGCMMSACASGG